MTTNNKDFKVKNGIQAGGLIESTASGFKFPDGTTQTTAYTGSGTDSTKVAKTGDTMTGLLTISSTGTALVLTSADATSANNSGILFTTTASSTASSRVASIIMDANGADGSGGDYVTLNAFGSGDFTINNRNAAAITLQTNATERVRIDSSGNVGIGTASPQALVHVHSPVGNSTIHLTGALGSSASNGMTLIVGAAGDASIYQRENNYLRFGTNNTERMRIDASGNVGVNTASPSSLLHVRGTTGTTLIVDGSATTTGAANTGSQIEFWGNDGVASYTWARIGGGKENGTSGNQASYFSIQTRVSGGALTERLRVDSVGDTVLANANGLCWGDKTTYIAGNSSTDIIQMFTSGTERFHISSAGNVGIGGTPTTKLDVISSASSDLISSVRTTGTTGASILSLSSGNGTTSSKYSYVRFMNIQTSPRDWRLGTYGNDNLTIRDETASSNRLIIDTNGTLLVGASSAVSSERARIENTSAGGVPNTLFLTNAGTTAGTGANLSFVSYTNATAASTIASISGISSDTSGNGLLAFNTSGVERMRIDASGNVLVTGSGGLGYGTGAGGTVTQATSKTTGVTLNKLSGAITLNASSLAANTAAAFTFTNSTIAASDVVHVSVKSGMATGGSYNVSVDAVNTGSCNISVRNLTAGALAEALVLNFVVIKAATS